MWKNYIAIWLLVTITLLVFVVISFLDPECLSSNNIRHASFKENLLTEVADVEQEFSAIDSTHQVVPVKCDSSSQNILIIGDSMLEGLNPRLAAYAKANGHRLNSVIWYSSTSEYWGDCDTLKFFLKRFNPSYIFISLGGNELFVKDIAAKRDKFVKRFLSQIGDIPYLWIGPPNWKPDTGVNDMIARNVKPGCFFLSNGMKFERQKDGAHPTHRSAALWFDSIARWMPQHAAHPILMNKPADSIKARPDHVVVLQPKH